MNKIKQILLFFIVLTIPFSMTACSGKKEKLVDGFYTVEMSDYSHDWKEFVTIRVSNSKIVTVEYNAKNSSGFIKSWDIAYMRNMNPLKGTYPNRYTRTYAADFLSSQTDENIDTVSGATSSGNNFKKMASALLEKAKTGDKTLGIVEYD